MINHKICVAVVDDDESFGRAMGRLLQAAGFEVAIFTSAEHFLAAAPLPPPECLLLDIQLAGMSGLELQRVLAAQGPTTPVIFVTALDDPGLGQEARQAGCSGFFSKPVPGRLLIQAIHSAVQASHS